MYIRLKFNALSARNIASMCAYLYPVVSCHFSHPSPQRMSYECPLHDTKMHGNRSAPECGRRRCRRRRCRRCCCAVVFVVCVEYCQNGIHISGNSAPTVCMLQECRYDCGSASTWTNNVYINCVLCVVWVSFSFHATLAFPHSLSLSLYLVCISEYNVFVECQNEQFTLREWGVGSV